MYSSSNTIIKTFIFLLFLISVTSSQNCSSIPNCKICEGAQCLQCTSRYSINASGTCSLNRRKYTALTIIACILLGILCLLSCGWILYGQILRWKRRQEIQIIRRHLQGLNIIDPNLGGPTTETQMVATNRVMLPSTPTISFLNSETCTICLDGNIQLRSSCEHYFHLQCILQWTTKVMICPNCRDKRPLFMILCRNCNSFNEVVKVCESNCRQKDHKQCFYKNNKNLLDCKNCQNR